MVKKKEMKEGCSDKCTFQCSRHPEEYRINIFNTYRPLENINEKRQCIVTRVTEEEPKRRRRREHEKAVKERTRNRTFTYSFPCPEETSLEIRACPTMFLNTLAKE